MILTSTKAHAQAIADSNAYNKKWYSEDEVSNEKISAYKMGKEHLKREEKKKTETAFQNAKSVAERVYFTMRKSKVICKEVRLRKLDLKRFEAIFLLSEKDFLSKEKYLTAYTIASNMLDNTTPEGLCFSYLFMPKNKAVDQAALIADGFGLTFKTVKVIK